MPKIISIEKGDKYGRLTIIKEIQCRITPGGMIKRQVICSCECGNEKVVVLNSLRSGATRSCGCYRKEVTTQTKTIHGLWKHPLYKTWADMKTRCYNTKDKYYKDYGGRGIKVCDRWIKSFPNFLQDMGERPTGYSIDRINNDGNYEPSNCRWATNKEQQNNQRRNTKSAQS